MMILTIITPWTGFFLATVPLPGSNGHCSSPQYAEIGREGLIDCVFPSTFSGVVWYDSQNTSNSQIARGERQRDGSLRITFESNDNASYTISSNGSLIIPFVTTKHDRNFSVLLLDENNVPSVSIVQLITVVYTHQSKPSINSCEGKLPCLTLPKENDTLSCTYTHARPAVGLTWYILSNEGKLERIEATQRTLLEDPVSFSSVVDIRPAIVTKNVLSIFTCQAFGQALRIQNVTEGVLVLNPRTEHCAKCGDAVQNKTVSADTRFEIPCTDGRIPYAYVWLYEQYEHRQIIAFSINMTLSFVNTLDIPMNVSKKGSLIVPRASLSSAGKYTCFFLNDGVSSFNVVKVEVEARGHPGTGHPGTGHPGTGHPGTVHPGEGHPKKADAFYKIISILLVVQLLFMLIIILLRIYLRKRSVCIFTELNIGVMSDVADALLDWPILHESDQPLFTEDAIDLLRSISQESINNERSKDKADAGAVSGFNIAGGTAAVLGTLLPFTVAGSIGAIVGGTALSVTGVSVATGFALDMLRKETERLKKAKPSFELFVEIQKKLAISIVHITNAYEIIELYQRNKKDIDKGILHSTVGEMKNLLKRIRRFQKDRNVTAQVIIDNVTDYSQIVVDTLLKGLEKSRDISFYIFEEQHKNYKLTYKRAFDMIPDTVLKLLSMHRHYNKRTFCYEFVKKLYAPGLTPQARSDMKLRSTVENTSPPVEVQLLNVKDDKAQVIENLEKLAKGVAVAQLVLNFLGTTVDVAFLGKGIYNIIGHKTEDLTKALNDTASMMENMNKIIRKREFPDTVVESSANYSFDHHGKKSCTI